jgi:flagellar biosynthesis component FlhA
MNYFIALIVSLGLVVTSYTADAKKEEPKKDASKAQAKKEDTKKKESVKPKVKPVGKDGKP